MNRREKSHCASCSGNDVARNGRDAGGRRRDEGARDVRNGRIGRDGAHAIRADQRGLQRETFVKLGAALYGRDNVVDKALFSPIKREQSGGNLVDRVFFASPTGLGTR